MAQRGFDEQMAALDALRGRELDEAAVAFIKKMLANRSNFLVAKAARLAEENNIAQLMPDLLAAYQRFFENPEKSDPQCWAKNALSRALAKMECRDKDVFLRGLTFHQYEPVWGGRSDTAGTLRGNCALAIVTCDGLTAQDLLLLLLDPLTDADKSVRVEAVRALAQLGELAVPLLRMRALLPGDDAEEMLGACFAALLAIEREDAIPFVARFLEAGDDAAGEAAFALAETHSQATLAVLLAQQKSAADPWFQSVMQSAIALTRLPEAIDFLLAKITGDERDAPMAIEALARLKPNEKLRSRMEKAVGEADSSRLKKALSEHLPPAPEEG